jgi:hypothetical protein
MDYDHRQYVGWEYVGWDKVIILKLVDWTLELLMPCKNICHIDIY